MLQFTDQLMNIAWRAFIYKKVEPLERPARLLMRLPYPHSAIGKYYMGVYLTRRGRHVESLQMLEQAALEAPRRFQARAICCMAAMAVDGGDFYSARTLNNEALKAAMWRTGCDTFVCLGSKHSRGLISAFQGEPGLALKMFLDLLPEMAASFREFPMTYFSLLNSISMELMALDRLNDAWRTLAVVLSAPNKVHNWLDTAYQVRVRMEWSGLREPHLPQFPDGCCSLGPPERGPIRRNRTSERCERSRATWPESLIKGCTLRGKLEAISALLNTRLSDEENDELLDLLTTLWFETGTWV